MCVYVCVYVRRIKGSYRFETRSRFPPGNAKRVVLWNKPVGQVYFGCLLSKEKKKKKDPLVSRRREKFHISVFSSASSSTFGNM